MGTPEFKPNKPGIAAFLVSGPMRAAVLGAGRDVAAEAARRTPRASGALAASYRVEPATATIRTRRDGETRRASGRVINDAPHAAALEFGHASPSGTPVPGVHVLGRMAATKAAKAAGSARRTAGGRSRRRTS